MHRSYVPKEWIDLFINDSSYPLPIEIAKRFVAVLRIKMGEEVAVFDGCGRQIRGYLNNNKPPKPLFFTQARLETQPLPSPSIVLVQAALDEAKISETIKRGCEFGVDKFIIFNANRSDKFSFSKLKAKEQRLIRIAQDASRQAGRFFIPAISWLDELDKIVINQRLPLKLGIFGDVKESMRLAEILKVQPQVEHEFYIVVGPEGGLSHDEVEFLKHQGFLGAVWAPYTLRSELAGLAAVAIFHAFYGRA